MSQEVTTPLVSDEQIAYMRMGAGIALRDDDKADAHAVDCAMNAAEGGCRFAMDLYEAHLKSLNDRLRAVEEAGIKLSCDRIDSVIIDAMKEASLSNGDLNAIDRSKYRNAVWGCIEQSFKDAALTTQPDKTT